MNATRLSRIGAALIVAAAAAVGACADRTSESAPNASSEAPARAAQARPSAPSAASRTPRIVILGDSLTAGLGLPIDEAYPSLLQKRLDAAGLKYEVINAGVSGDTSAGGLSRLDWALAGNVRILIVALGGNDALRGLPIEELRANLSQIIERAEKRSIAVILAGMEAPPNWGRDYVSAFHSVYPALARTYHIPLVPFLLEGVAGIDSLNQRDHIHPTAQGDQIVADTVWKVLEPVAKQQASAPGP